MAPADVARYDGDERPRDLLALPDGDILREHENLPMAWRPEHLVRAGELDNTQFGWITGWLELEGIDQPLQLKLAGNCHPDLAGWKFRIHRLEPEPPQADDGEDPPDLSGIRHDQSGHAGDFTADQMVKHFDIPTDEWVRRLHAGESPPFTWRKCVYLEWYSNHNGRVVIQSTRLEAERLGQRAFELTEEQWREQARQNAQELNHFMFQLGDALDHLPSVEDDDDPDSR